MAAKRQKLGPHKSVIERSFDWITRFERPTLRYERRNDIHHDIATIGCAIICFRAWLSRF